MFRAVIHVLSEAEDYISINDICRIIRSQHNLFITNPGNLEWEVLVQLLRARDKGLVYVKDDLFKLSINLRKKEDERFVSRWLQLKDELRELQAEQQQAANVREEEEEPIAGPSGVNYRALVNANAGTGGPLERAIVDIEQRSTNHGGQKRTATGKDKKSQRKAQGSLKKKNTR